MPLPLSDWETFYVITGGAGAALTGLMFVVVALAADRGATTTSNGISVYSTPTVIHLSGVIVVSALMAVPHQSVMSLAVCLGLGGVAGFIAMSIAASHMRNFKDYVPDHGDWLWHILLPMAGYAILILSAFLLGGAQDLALDLIAAVAIAFLLVGIHNAWDVAVFLVALPARGERPAPAPAAPSAVPVEPAPSTAQTDPPRPV